MAPVHRAPDAAGATRSVVALHATEPATVHLSLQARVEGLGTGEVDRALHDERSLVRQLAMRRTLFVFPRDLLGAAWGSASAGSRPPSAPAWSRTSSPRGWPPTGRGGSTACAPGAGGAGRRARGAHGPRPAPARPGLEARLGGGATYAGSRVLTWLGARAEVVRGPQHHPLAPVAPALDADGHWLGDPPPTCGSAEGYVELVRRWLLRFGPGTEADLVWWLGATKGAVRASLAALGAVEVGVGAGERAYLLPDDVEEEAPVEPWAALLPVLDPTAMGWRQRDFHLGPHQPRLFDRNGNAGTTAWWSGRVVGCWVQDGDGAVEVRLVEDVGAEARAGLAREAARLGDWLDGQRVGTVYPSPLMRADPADLTHPVVRA
ncbi:winged helix DNA-binding domain-containing protein [Nocardioides marinisabuli]|uniref:winged helix DNA-binding domain-containing protein n=1 Tax=Nocardioides marinisabuli TaxID=419476 RepID=UPI0015DE1719|nr:winged helix DNA-binding domain-containing protein [Nocardioides marinisabuli]